VGADRAQGRRYFGNDNTEMYCTREGGGDEPMAPVKSS